MANFRWAAVIVAQAQLDYKSPMACARLIDQLGRTLRTIGDAHVAREETNMARALVITGDASRVKIAALDANDPVEFVGNYPDDAHASDCMVVCGDPGVLSRCRGPVQADYNPAPHNLLPRGPATP